MIQNHGQGPSTHLAPVVAVIAHHNQEHTMALARDVHDHPDRYTAAAGINAHRLGQIDPEFLCHTRNVLKALPCLATDATNDLEHYLITADDGESRRVWAGRPAAVGSEPQEPCSRTACGMAAHHEQSHALPATV